MSVAGLALGHGVDGEVAPLQVLLQGHVGREQRGEAAIAGRDLALEARQRVLLVRLRMQEHREFACRPRCSPGAVSSSGVAPTTTQSRSPTGRPSSRSRTAPPTKYTCMMLMLTESPAPGAAGSGRAVPRRRPARAWSALCACALLPGCGSIYLLQAARGQWHVLHARVPIDTVLADPRTPPELRARLATVRAARDFASRELGLPDNSSYRSYADIGRPFVVWNVVAAPEFSVQPRRWCFPVAGCVAYRGYFHRAQARDFALSLEAQGYRRRPRRRAGLLDAGQFRRPGAQHHAALRRRPAGGHHLPRAGAPAAVCARTTRNSTRPSPPRSRRRGSSAGWRSSRARRSACSASAPHRREEAAFVALLARCRGELATLYASRPPRR